MIIIFIECKELKFYNYNLYKTDNSIVYNSKDDNYDVEKFNMVLPYMKSKIKSYYDEIFKFIKYPDSEKNILTKNSFISGGCLSALYNNDKISDIDIFIYGKLETEKLMRLILRIIFKLYLDKYPELKMSNNEISNNIEIEIDRRKSNDKMLLENICIFDDSLFIGKHQIELKGRDNFKNVYTKEININLTSVLHEYEIYMTKRAFSFKIPNSKIKFQFVIMSNIFNTPLNVIHKFDMSYAMWYYNYFSDDMYISKSTKHSIITKSFWFTKGFKNRVFKSKHLIQKTKHYVVRVLKYVDKGYYFKDAAFLWAMCVTPLYKLKEFENEISPNEDDTSIDYCNNAFELGEHNADFYYNWDSYIYNIKTEYFKKIIRLDLNIWKNIFNVNKLNCSFPDISEDYFCEIKQKPKEYSIEVLS